MDQQSIRARGLLLEIVRLMIQHNVTLDYDIEQNWFDQLVKIDQVRIKINILINIVAN